MYQAVKTCSLHTWRTWVLGRRIAVVGVLVAYACALQGCSPGVLPRSCNVAPKEKLRNPPRTTLLQVSTEEEDDEDSEPKSQLPTAPAAGASADAAVTDGGSAEDDGGASPPSILQRADAYQQDELQQEYKQMQRTDDPDEIDKEMKKAWARLEHEDQHITQRALQHRGIRRKAKQRVALSQLGESTSRFSFRSQANVAHADQHGRRLPAMLNHRHKSVAAASTVLFAPLRSLSVAARRDDAVGALSLVAVPPPGAVAEDVSDFADF